MLNALLPPIAQRVYGPCDVRQLSYITGSLVTFSDVRQLLSHALRTGAYRHVAQRANFEAKNWLAHGRVSTADVLRLLRACTAREHRQSAHHQSARLRVHEFVVTCALRGFDR